MIKEVIFDTIKRRGFMLVLSSPSGAGKTTLAKEVLVHEKALELSISVTTRPKRESEKEGLDYYFVDEETFTQMVDEKQLLVLSLALILIICFVAKNRTFLRLLALYLLVFIAI